MEAMTTENHVQADVLDELRIDTALFGDASGTLGRAIAEIERLRTALESAATFARDILQHVADVLPEA